MDDRWCAFRRERTAEARCGLREKGVPSARDGSRGDQYVEIQVVVPKPTDERVRKLMKELETIEPDNPRKDLFSKAGG